MSRGRRAGSRRVRRASVDVTPASCVAQYLTQYPFGCASVDVVRGASVDVSPASRVARCAF